MAEPPSHLNMSQRGFHALRTATRAQYLGGTTSPQSQHHPSSMKVGNPKLATATGTSQRLTPSSPRVARIAVSPARQGLVLSTMASSRQQASQDDGEVGRSMLRCISSATPRVVPDNGKTPSKNCMVEIVLPGMQQSPLARSCSRETVDLNSMSLSERVCLGSPLQEKDVADFDSVAETITKAMLYPALQETLSRVQQLEEALAEETKRSDLVKDALATECSKGRQLEEALREERERNQQLKDALATKSARLKKLEQHLDRNSREMDNALNDWGTQLSRLEKLKEANKQLEQTFATELTQITRQSDEPVTKLESEKGRLDVVIERLVDKECLNSDDHAYSLSCDSNLGFRKDMIIGNNVSDSCGQLKCCPSHYEEPECHCDTAAGA